MNENSMDVYVDTPPDGVSDSESVVTDSLDSENSVESDSDSVNSSSGLSGVAPVVNVDLESLIDSEKGAVPVYIIEDETESVEEETEESLYDDELGGVPVVLVDDATTSANYASSGGVSYQLPTYYVDYFSGVLANMRDTDYLCFCTREYPYNNDYWVEHYRLVYDLSVSDDSVASGEYPCIDIYRHSSSSNYNVDRTTYALTTIPDFAYGSFGSYSDLREGASHDETWAVLFFLGFFAVYSVCHDIFDYVMSRVYRHR